MLTYTKGSVLAVRGTFTNAAGIPQDPSTVYAYVRSPAGKETKYTYGVNVELQRESQGVYKIDVHLNESGLWNVCIESEGLGEAAGERQYFVRPSAF